MTFADEFHTVTTVYTYYSPGISTVRS